MVHLLVMGRPSLRGVEVEWRTRFWEMNKLENWEVSVFEGISVCILKSLRMRERL